MYLRKSESNSHVYRKLAAGIKISPAKTSRPLGKKSRLSDTETVDKYYPLLYFTAGINMIITENNSIFNVLNVALILQTYMKV